MRHKVALALLPFALVAAFSLPRAHAAPEKPFAETYGQISGTMAAHRGTVTSTGDSKVTVTAATSDLQSSGGNPSVVLRPTFSAPAATVTYSVWVFTAPAGNGTVAHVGTITASSVFRVGAAGNYQAENGGALVDLEGFPYFEVRYHDVSSGTITPFGFTVGPAPAFLE